MTVTHTHTCRPSWCYINHVLVINLSPITNTVILRDWDCNVPCIYIYMYMHNRQDLTCPLLVGNKILLKEFGKLHFHKNCILRWSSKWQIHAQTQLINNSCCPVHCGLTTLLILHTVYILSLSILTSVTSMCYRNMSSK